MADPRTQGYIDWVVRTSASTGRTVAADPGQAKILKEAGLREGADFHEVPYVDFKGYGEFLSLTRQPNK